MDLQKKKSFRWELWRLPIIGLQLILLLILWYRSKPKREEY